MLPLHCEDDAEPVYTPNQTVRVSFVGGHPNNNLMTQDTYLEVIRIDSMKQVCTTKRFLFFKTTECEDVPDDITVVARDNDPETKFIWVRHHTDRSRIDIEWTIPDTILPGQYMITHYGHWKDGNPFSSTFGQSVPYEGSSRIFTVTR